jgi:hypothetical protein
MGHFGEEAARVLVRFGHSTWHDLTQALDDSRSDAELALEGDDDARFVRRMLRLTARGIRLDYAQQERLRRIYRERQPDRGAVAISER